MAKWGVELGLAFSTVRSEYAAQAREASQSQEQPPYACRLSLKRIETQKAKACWVPCFRGSC